MIRWTIMSKESNRGRMDGVMSKGYGTIPKLVMQHEDLSIEAKAIYAYLASYAGAGDTAYPSVSIMCKHLGISRDRFYRHRKSLLELDFIRIAQHQSDGGWSNNIYTVVSLPCPQNKDTQNKDTQNKDTQNKDTNNNSLNNNSSINNSSINTSVEVEKYPYQEVIEYLNEKTGKSISYRSNGNKKLIRARINEGYTVEDFKKVIDNKVSDWLGKGIKFSNGKPAENYLHPTTLFAQSNFDKYLNEQKVEEARLTPSQIKDKEIRRKTVSKWQS